MTKMNKRFGEGRECYQRPSLTALNIPSQKERRFIECAKGVGGKGMQKLRGWTMSV